MSYKIGFIGCGNMATGILKGIIDNSVNYEKIYLFDIDRSKTDVFINMSSNIESCDNTEELISLSDLIFICVKPNVLNDALSGIKCQNKAFISIAAGVKLNVIKALINNNSCRYMRVMPNMPMKVGEGAICIANNQTFNDEENSFIKALFSKIGNVITVDEADMDAVTAISGSGPAYVFYILDAMIDAGIKIGLDYKTSFKLSMQTFIGSLQMIDLDSDLKVLCDSICSKGGTTIEAIKVFEDNNLKDIIYEAIKACKEKSIILSESFNE